MWFYAIYIKGKPQMQFVFPHSCTSRAKHCWWFWDGCRKDALNVYFTINNIFFKHRIYRVFTVFFGGKQRYLYMNFSRQRPWSVLTRFLNRFDDFLSRFERFVSRFDRFWWTVLIGFVSCFEHPWIIRDEPFLTRFWPVNTFWTGFDYLLNTFWLLFDYILNTSWPCFEKVLKRFRFWIIKARHLLNINNTLSRTTFHLLSEFIGFA